jgi:hypothetical protein
MVSYTWRVSIVSHFYSYLWLRQDGSPYYVGKGSGLRAYKKQSHRVPPPPVQSRILIFPQESEADAFQSEKDLIALFGRKDIGTGILRNLTDGGDDPPHHKGKKLSLTMRMRLSATNRGKSFSTQARAGMSRAQGSPEARARMAAKLKGRIITWGAKISQANKGHRQACLKKAWDTRFLRTVAWG